MSGMSGRSRKRARHAAARQPGAPAGPVCAAAVMPGSCRIWTRLPTMTTPMRITPWSDRRSWGRRQERHVRPDELQDHDGDDRPEEAAAAAGQADAAEHDRRRRSAACTGPGTGVPMPVLAVSDSPARAANRPGDHVRRGSWSGRPATPLRNAASWLLPMAYSDRPSLERRSGIQITATTTISTTAALGTHVDQERAHDEVLEPVGCAAAGRGQ